MTLVLRVIRAGCWKNIEYQCHPGRCINEKSIKLTRKMLWRARRDNKLWGSGIRPPVVVTEKHVVSVATYNHLRDWIFNTDFIEQLKATEHATQRCQCFGVREAASSTYPRYRFVYMRCFVALGLTLTVTGHPSQESGQGSFRGSC